MTLAGKHGENGVGMRTRNPPLFSPQDLLYEREMNRASVLATLKQLEPRFRAHGVAALYLYGSYARDEARPDSDIDVLVDFDEGRDKSFSDYMAAYHMLSEEFPGTEIGYGTRENIVPVYRPHIEGSAMRVF